MDERKELTYREFLNKDEEMTAFLSWRLFESITSCELTESCEDCENRCDSMYKKRPGEIGANIKLSDCTRMINLDFNMDSWDIMGDDEIDEEKYQDRLTKINKFVDSITKFREEYLDSAAKFKKKLVEYQRQKKVFDVKYKKEDSDD